TRHRREQPPTALKECEMLRRHRERPTTTATATTPAFADFHDWVLSLPWVVERPYHAPGTGVRCFGVDCEPLARRQLWLITGMRLHRNAGDIGLGVVVPDGIAAELEEAGRGCVVAPMPGRGALVTVPVDSGAGRWELEALALTAYGNAMS